MIKSIVSTFFLSFILLAGSAQNRTLDYFLKLANQNSPLLKEYQNKLESNRIDSLRLRAGLGTQVNAVSNNSYAPVIKGVGQDEAITNGANIFAALSVSKEVISAGNLQNQLHTVELQKSSILNPAKISEQDLKRNVTDQYIAVFGLLQQVNFYGELLNLMRKEEILFKKLTSTGVYKQTDFLTFEVLIQQQELQLVQVRNQYRNGFRSLNYLCGEVDSTVFLLYDPALTLEKLPELQHSIFYQQFVIDSLSLSTARKQIDFNYQPKLNLFGDVSYNSSLVYQPWKNFGPNFGLNLSIPIYDGRQKKMQHDQIALSEQTRRTYSEFFAKQYRQQINQLLLQLSDNQKYKMNIDKQIAYSQALVEANGKLFQTGEVNVTEYFIAISSLLTSRNLLIQNRLENYQLINQLNYWCREK
ncbi:MAG: TolC family protein [Prolixibacteraceae bacterium]